MYYLYNVTSRLLCLSTWQMFLHLFQFQNCFLSSLFFSIMSLLMWWYTLKALYYSTQLIDTAGAYLIFMLFYSFNTIWDWRTAVPIYPITITVCLGVLNYVDSHRECECWSYTIAVLFGSYRPSELITNLLANVETKPIAWLMLLGVLSFYLCKWFEELLVVKHSSSKFVIIYHESDAFIYDLDNKKWTLLAIVY